MNKFVHSFPLYIGIVLSEKTQDRAREELKGIPGSGRALSVFKVIWREGECRALVARVMHDVGQVVPKFVPANRTQACLRHGIIIIISFF